MNALKRHKSIPILILLLSVVILFVFLTPKVRATFFPQTSTPSFQQFRNTISESSNLNPQDYWKFKEFYSPGIYSVNKSGFNSGEIKTFRISLPKEIQQTPDFVFLKFESPNLQSIDGLTTENSLKNIFDTKTINMHNLITLTDKVLFYQVNPKKYILVTLYNPDDMKKTVGFWDYQKDTNIIDNKNWISISRITLPE